MLLLAVLVSCGQTSAGASAPPMAEEPATAVEATKLAPPRGTKVALPAVLESRLKELANCRDRTQSRARTEPVQDVESDAPALLLGYYNISSDAANGAFTPQSGGAVCAAPVRSAIGTVRLVVEVPAHGYPDLADPATKVDYFTDVCGVQPIESESGWYEGWLVHDLKVPPVADAEGQPIHVAPGAGSVTTSLLTQADADRLAEMGEGENVPGNLFTVDGLPPKNGTLGQTTTSGEANVISVFVSLGTWNALRGEDAHAYFRLDAHTNWVAPSNERAVAPRHVEDDATSPRDPDRTPDRCGGDARAGETRLRRLPSGVAREILIDAYMRLASFLPHEKDTAKRLARAYETEVAKLDRNRDGVLQFSEIDESSAKQVFVPPRELNRFVVTREINDGLLGPRLVPSAQAFVLAGSAKVLAPGEIPGPERTRVLEVEEQR